MDRNDRNLLEDSQAVNTIAPKGALTSKPAESARGMAGGLTLLTMRRGGEFQLGVKTKERILDVPEAARSCRCTLPPPSTTCYKMKMVPD